MKEQPTPKYRQIYKQLANDIETGTYAPGDRIPSEADLVKKFRASRITVGRAVHDLRQDGLVERRVGSGTFVKVGRREKSVEKRGLSFGLLIPDLGRTEIFEPICQGLADAPQAGDHALLWSSSISPESGASVEEQAARICRQYIARNVSGVFFAPFESVGSNNRIDERIVTALDRAGIPVVLLDRDFLPYPRRSRHDLVGIDNRRAGFMATQHLLELGARRIAFFSYPGGPSTLDERMAGYREALHMHGIPVDCEWCRRIPEDDLDRVRTLMETQRPEAFVCGNDRTAGRLMHRLIGMGVRIPGDVRIVGIDDIAYAGLLPVPLTTIRQPCREIGNAAMTIMLERIRHPETAPRDVLLECTLVLRDSCGAKALAAVS